MVLLVLLDVAPCAPPKADWLLPYRRTAFRAVNGRETNDECAAIARSSQCRRFVY
jgi:hypothetical protein